MTWYFDPDAEIDYTPLDIVVERKWDPTQPYWTYDPINGWQLHPPTEPAT